ncbi:MAG: helix-turn-helix domain-containing protein [Thermoanaerobaculia bacterium]|nr:helix-turn-helix domain-containing protein [Thermoanaerobaculia bacterium]
MRQNHSALLAETPVRLFERPLSDFAAALREGEPSRELVATIDFVLRHQVARALSRDPGRVDLAELHDDLARVMPVRLEERLPEATTRWRTLSDLVSTRIGMLDTQEPETARNLLHAEEILTFVAANPGTTQAEIGRELGLKPANLTRILGILEANELIERQAVGREKRVHLGRLERQRRAEEYPAGPIDHGHEVAEPPTPRFADYLCPAA